MVTVILTEGDSASVCRVFTTNCRGHTVNLAQADGLLTHDTQRLRCCCVFFHFVSCLLFICEDVRARESYSCFVFSLYQKENRRRSFSWNCFILTPTTTSHSEKHCFFVFMQPTHDVDQRRVRRVSPPFSKYAVIRDNPLHIGAGTVQQRATYRS